MEIYLVRHCKAEGQSPSADLTAEGYVQANRLAVFLYERNIQNIYSSPYMRAIKSIEPLAHRINLSVTIDDRLTERILSGVDHPNWREMLRNTFSNPDLSYDGGESSTVAMNRILSVVRDVKESGLNTTAIVTHGNIMSLLLKHYDDNFNFYDWESLSNPDVYHIQFTNHKPILKRIWT